MKIKIILIGKTEEKYLKEGCSIYLQKLTHYCPIEYIELADLKQTKNLSRKEQKIREGKLILTKLHVSDTVVLLDEKGEKYSSIDFSKCIEKYISSSIKQLVFVVGGAYGFSEEVYEKAITLLSLSPMTFSHQMIRLLFLEQLYRAFTILNNEPYHHK